MRIAIATVQVPFTTGGAETLAALLRDELRARGHQADIVSIPFKWYPARTLLNCMLAGRMLDLTEVNGETIDLVIATKFPAYYLKHPNKVIWLCHQHRQAYDLWGTAYGDLHGTPEGGRLRSLITANDNQYIREAKKVFTIADNPAKRLRQYNGIDAVTLYHPPRNHQQLQCSGYENFVFYPSRIDPMKRQQTLIEAARHLRSDTKIYIAGTGSGHELERLRALIDTCGVGSRVKLLGYITEQEKLDCYARCLAVYFGAYDEDYGYVTLESFLSEKPVIAHHDAGGPLEFIEDGRNGFLVPPEPEAVARHIDALAADTERARAMGQAGRRHILGMRISWDHVIESLLGS